MELMPERCTTSNMTNSSQNRETPRDFETLLLTVNIIVLYFYE